MPVSLLDSELNIPGLYLFHDFVTAKEEEVFSSCNPMSLLNSLYIHMEFHKFCDVFATVLCPSS